MAVLVYSETKRIKEPFIINIPAMAQYTLLIRSIQLSFWF